jgi:hypothetical protein
MALFKLAKEDTMLFAVTYVFGTQQDSQPIVVAHGGYAMRLELGTSGQPAPVARVGAAGAAATFTAGYVDAATAFAQVPRPAARSRARRR